MCESLCNRFCAIDTDVVDVLQRTRYPSHTKKNSTRSAKKAQANTETKSHQRQILQAGIMRESLCNRFCAIVSDVVAVLQRTRYPSHIKTTLKALQKRPKKQNSYLTRYRVPTLEFCVRACAIVFAPSSPMSSSFCDSNVTHHALKEQNTICKHSTTKKRDQISQGTESPRLNYV